MSGCERNISHLFIQVFEKGPSSFANREIKTRCHKARCLLSNSQWRHSLVSENCDKLFKRFLQSYRKKITEDPIGLLKILVLERISPTKHKLCGDFCFDLRHDHTLRKVSQFWVCACVKSFSVTTQIKVIKRYLPIALLSCCAGCF